MNIFRKVTFVAFILTALASNHVSAAPAGFGLIHYKQNRCKLEYASELSELEKQYNIEQIDRLGGRMVIHDRGDFRLCESGYLADDTRSYCVQQPDSIFDIEKLIFRNMNYGLDYRYKYIIVKYVGLCDVYLAVRRPSDKVEK